MSKITVLKVDIDCHVSSEWLHDRIELTRFTCKLHGITVLSIKKTNSRKKGIHLYIRISPPVEAMFADQLQWLLGDDCRRVDFNRARIRAGLQEWNKLFEEPCRRMRTIYDSRWTRRRS